MRRSLGRGRRWDGTLGPATPGAPLEASPPFRGPRGRRQLEYSTRRWKHRAQREDAEGPAGPMRDTRPGRAVVGCRRARDHATPGGLRGRLGSGRAQPRGSRRPVASGSARHGQARRAAQSLPANVRKPGFPGHGIRRTIEVPVLGEPSTGSTLARESSKGCVPLEITHMNHVPPAQPNGGPTTTGHGLGTGPGENRTRRQCHQPRGACRPSPAASSRRFCEARPFGPARFETARPRAPRAPPASRPEVAPRPRQSP